MWKDLEEAAFDAVARPGHVRTVDRIKYLVRHDFLWCQLPSGRPLSYGAPRVREVKTPWGDRKPAVTCLGVDSVTRKWRRFALYGGLATENVVQAIARDCLRDGMLRAERAGYPIVMTVHDEAVAEVPDDFGSLAEFETLLCSMEPWAEGLPVVAAGYEAKRYRK
jgi:DNA polymerase